MDANQIRQTFKEFFASKGHRIVESASMIVKDDPTLMFTNAGMNPFKEVFLGQASPAAPRVADSQKCLRVSGKHNDLEEVGHDTYHHTMFEMLGNWSFGDYFKREAIDWAWELLTEVYKLDRDRLYVTVFGGDQGDGLGCDEEAAGFWRAHVAPDRVLSGSKKDNFWEMGATGPCGPCSEIHIDLRPDAERAATPGRDMVNAGHPQVVEIWNLVFIQFNRRDDGSLEPLPQRHVDTGMGFERLCMALQGKQSNYDTDVFQPYIREIEALSGKKYGDDPKTDVAMRVVADHLRAVAFAIADGQLPSNNKAGYVIRRILRRGIRYGYTFLGQQQPFIHRLVATLVREMGQAYPELGRQQSIIEKVIQEEESTFLRTLAAGIRMLEGRVAKLRAQGGATLDGADAFELYDTYGFPPDLTSLILREAGLELDQPGFEAAMARQKERSRVASQVEAGDWVEVRPGNHTDFEGYDADTLDAHILAYRHAKVKGKDALHVILDRTPFYAESGGQVGDSGTLTCQGETLRVLDTRKENNLLVHTVDRLPREFGGTFTACVDKERRRACECNHTATHLLHFALRETLGGHVEQKGSYVGPDRLRFDFAHFQKMTPEEIRRVEDRVNALIRADIARDERRGCPIDEARAMGAMALFGEKYGENVRVVRYGDSVELCGGTHAARTGQAGLFVIVAEAAIAAGIRRIEALTGQAALEHLRGHGDTLEALRGLLKNAADPVKGVETLLESNRAMARKLEEAGREKLRGVKAKLQADMRNVNGMNVISGVIEADSADAIKDLCGQLRAEVPGLFCALGAEVGGKAVLGVALADDIVARGLRAGDIIRAMAREVGGGGGGQAHFATAGGKDPGKLGKAIEVALEAANAAQ